MRVWETAFIRPFAPLYAQNVAGPPSARPCAVIVEKDAPPTPTPRCILACCVLKITITINLCVENASPSFTRVARPGEMWREKRLEHMHQCERYFLSPPRLRESSSSAVCLRASRIAFLLALLVLLLLVQVFVPCGRATARAASSSVCILC
mmetsp:Transcript_25441/g.77228  ORF Transcript_25441/g.77228 Transcript_25441/m.77228 type:complete len:151 (+) Transcript_25441:1719-2171(+)